MFFANAQTGNILLVGVSISEGNWALAGRYFFPVVSFAVGIMLADLVHERFGSVIHWRQVTVFFEAVILLGVSFIPRWRLQPARQLSHVVCLRHAG